jgi:uridine phosphorylase
MVRSTAVRSASATPLSPEPVEGSSVISPDQHNRALLSGYLRPTAPIAPDALLVADPGVAMALAQVVLVKPLMSNHHHGLWGYSGMTAVGRALTVQSTGIGGPSTLAVVDDLAALGVTRTIRIAACDTLDEDLAGAVLVAEAALGLDGASAALGTARPRADAALSAALAEALGAERVTAAGYDLAVATANGALQARWVAAGARVADRETAAFLGIAEVRNIAAAAALIVGAEDEGLIETGASAAAVLQLG